MGETLILSKGTARVDKGTYNNEVIVVKNLSKRFKIPLEKRTTVLENLVGIVQGRRVYNEFWALRNISFSVKKGETLGIIGENGSGKSTLMKIIAGVLYPDKGEIHVKGRIAPFLELGVGFQGDLTARENVYLYGSILGMGKKEMDGKYDDIIDFAELKPFENMKIKNFSSGMYARLAFATAVATEPDILLLDEVLAVGDEKFQMKCREKMMSFKKEGATIILVSHSLDAIQSMCDRAILLEHGDLKISGNVWEVGDLYRGDMGVKHMATPSLFTPLGNEILDTAEVTFSWDINNQLTIVDNIEFRIRDITDSDDGKLAVLRLPKNATKFVIKGVQSGEGTLKQKKYRWTIKIRSSLPSRYMDSEWGPPQIFFINGKTLDLDNLTRST